MATILDSFCIYHVTAPGQEPGAKDLPDGFVYPNMDELSEQVIFFVAFFIQSLFYIKIVTHS